MLKIFVGFVIFAALAMFVILKGGNSLDMGGEKHGDEPFMHQLKRLQPLLQVPQRMLLLPSDTA